MPADNLLLNSGNIRHLFLTGDYQIHEFDIGQNEVFQGTIKIWNSSSGTLMVFLMVLLKFITTIKLSDSDKLSRNVFSQYPISKASLWPSKLTSI